MILVQSLLIFGSNLDIYHFMNTDEQDIVIYLKAWRGTFVSGREIARRVGSKERFTQDRSWALPILVTMVRNGILETDYLGHYRLKPITQKKKRKRTYVAPQFLKILKSSGKSFASVSNGEEPDEEVFVISTETDQPEPAAPTLRGNQTAGKVK